MSKKKAIGVGILVLIVLAVILAFVLAPEKSGAHQRVYPLGDREGAYGHLYEDGVQVLPLEGDESGSITVYTQSPEFSGASSRLTWVSYHEDGRGTLLQDRSYSMPFYCAFVDDTIYIFGQTTGFSTVSGINITKYTITEDQLVIENAVEEGSIGARFYVYQDEMNDDLTSILPVTEDTGYLYFDEITDLANISATVIDGTTESKISFVLNSSGRYTLQEETG